MTRGARLASALRRGVVGSGRCVRSRSAFAVLPGGVADRQGGIATSTAASLRRPPALLAIRSFRSTVELRLAASDGDGKAQQASGTDQKTETGDDDEIPVWQNPRHHNNPERQNMFAEDFEGTGQEMPILPLPPINTSDPNKVVAPPHIHQLAHEVVQLSMLEMKELTDRISDHFGFDDSVLAGGYGAGAPAGNQAADTDTPVEEKTQFDLKLTGFDAKAKIKVIKEVRAIAGLGLKEAKELVESAPKTVQKELSQEKADELKAQLEAVGATVEIV